MDYRKRKQIIITSVLAVFLILVLVGVYFSWIKQPATCFDGKQNQKEGGVDCSGPCAMSCERLTIKDVQVEWVEAVQLKDGHYDLAAKITNPNPNYGLSLIRYTFKVFDEAGASLLEQKGKDFILPGQSKYLIEGNLALSTAPAKVTVTIDKASKEEWLKLSQDYQTPEIYVHDKLVQPLADNKEGIQASGIIKNNSNYDFDRILVTIVLFDENNKIIGVNKTEARTVLAGEDRYFTALWFSPFSAEIKSAEMQVDTNLFSNDNFMLRFGVSEKFQEY